MSIRLGEIAPDFTQQSTEGPLSFHAWAGESWVILFALPPDCAPVAATELGALARLKPELDRRNVKALALSVCSLDIHDAWVRDIAQTQETALNFPLLADTDRTVSRLYDLLPDSSASPWSMRSAILIGPDKRIKMLLSYPAGTGLSLTEILRVIDSLQLTLDYPVATPADWQPGQDCLILPAVSDEEAARQFPLGMRRLSADLRLTPPPNV